MTYTMCIHNLIITIRKNVRLWALVELEQSRSAVIRSMSVICLQLSCLFNKRELGNRYGPF